MLPMRRGRVVVCEATGSQLTGLEAPILGREVMICQIANGKTIPMRPWSSPRMEIIPLIKVFPKGTVGVIPSTEIMHASPDLLGPAPGGVREQRQVGIRLARFLVASASAKLGCHDCFETSLMPRTQLSQHLTLPIDKVNKCLI